MEMPIVENNLENLVDFEEHKAKAIIEYKKVFQTYNKYCEKLQNLFTECLQDKGIKFQSVDSRAKTIESFGQKAAMPSEQNPHEIKYREPLKEITDLAGVRIITYLPSTIKDIDLLIRNEFEVIEHSNKFDALEKEERFGYQSYHYLIKLNSNRITLPEWAAYKNITAEIQVRTLLQHAWAEIEHDIQYKTSLTIPTEIKRRFLAIAAILELADNEFQAINEANEELKNKSQKNVKSGRYAEVEITGEVLKSYLDNKIGSDGRISNFSYEYTARNLIKMGFSNLKQVDDCISPYNFDKLSVIIWGKRVGQISKFEITLVAGLGRDILKVHPFCIDKQHDNEFWNTLYNNYITLLEKKKQTVGHYKLPGVV